METTHAMTPDRLFTAARRTLAVPIAILLSGCPPIPPGPPQPPPGKPLITARPGRAAMGPPSAEELFGGSLYPHPTDPAKLELDAPLTTELDGTASPYFVLSLHVVTDNGQILELAWQDGADHTPIRSLDTPTVSGPCEEPGKMMSMRATSERQVGRSGPASYDANTDAFVAHGTPVWWLDCPVNPDPSAHGALLSAPDNSHPGKLHQNFIVLLPAKMAHAPTNAHDHGLTVRAVNLTNQLKSDATFVAVERSPILVGVVGDSIAWGQGLTEDHKFYSLVTTHLAQALARPAWDFRLVVRARSGTLLASATPSISIEQPGRSCDLPLADPRTATGAKYGEVPDDNPLIPCQLQDLTRRTCQVALPDGVTSHVFSVACHDGAPQEASPVPVTDVATAGPVDVLFRLGARYDFLLMDGCINDLGGANIAFGLRYQIGPVLYEVDPALIATAKSSTDLRARTDASVRVAEATARGAATGFLLPGRDLVRNGQRSDALTRDVVNKCTVSNAIGDLAQVLPNATIAYFGYHVYLSNDSMSINCAITGCAVGSAVLPAGPLACAAGALATPLARAQAAARVEQWVSDSNRVLGQSLGALPRTGGKGSIAFVPTTPPFAAQTAAFAPGSQTFGLSCGPLQGVDEVRAAREAACDLAHPPPDAAHDVPCRVTSAFHPDVAGHQVIARQIEDALKAAGRFQVAPGQ
jgi:hypothetical protein